jgi:hypothetical protein
MQIDRVHGNWLEPFDILGEDLLLVLAQDYRSRCLFEQNFYRIIIVLLARFLLWLYLGQLDSKALTTANPLRLCGIW